MKKSKPWCTFKTSNGDAVKIDREDLPRVAEYTWRTIRKETGRLKVVTDVKTPKGYRQISLGKFLVKPPKGKMVYPRRFVDGLDYRKDNLIVCSMRERQQILPKHRKGGSSRYKGVSYIQKLKVWRAVIKVSGKSISLGSFKTEAEAARAYNVAAKKFFGEMAYQNIITAKAKGQRRSDG